jgi:hypothetical protein
MICNVRLDKKEGENRGKVGRGEVKEKEKRKKQIV